MTVPQKASSPAEFSPYRKLPSGRVVKLKALNPDLMRAVMPKDLLKEIEGNPDDPQALVAKAKERIGKDPQLLFKIMTYLIMDGVEEPTFTVKPENEIKRDEDGMPLEVHVSWLGEDLPALLKEIAKFNGLTQAFQQVSQ